MGEQHEGLTEIANDDVFASVAFTGDRISGELTVYNPLGLDKANISVHSRMLPAEAHGSPGTGVLSA